MIRDALEDLNQAGEQSDRNDATDTGVPMLKGDGRERVGPEDAFGKGLKRGDYANRLGNAGGGGSFTSELIPEAERVPGGPISRLVRQDVGVAEIGDTPGKKGGVDS